jgi:hypothetical protein
MSACPTDRIMNLAARDFFGKNGDLVLSQKCGDMAILVARTRSLIAEILRSALERCKIERTDGDYEMIEFENFICETMEDAA